jgi:hypothetical protein
MNKRWLRDQVCGRTASVAAGVVHEHARPLLDKYMTSSRVPHGKYGELAEFILDVDVSDKVHSWLLTIFFSRISLRNSDKLLDFGLGFEDFGEYSPTVPNMFPKFLMCSQ